MKINTNIKSILFFIVFLNVNNKIFSQNPLPNALNLGLKANSSANQSLVLQKILQENKQIYIPKGKYFLSKIIIPSNVHIYTDGYETKFVQMKGMKPYDYMIRFEASENVIIQKFSVEGTFKTEPGKNTPYMALVNIRGGSKKITFEGIHAINAWGDGLLITGNRKVPSRNPKNILIKEIIASNCYRDGVSVVGGINITFDSVFTEKCGLAGFNAEAENAIVNNLTVNYFNGGAFRITTHGKAQMTNVLVKNLICDGNKVNGISKQFHTFDNPQKQLHGLILGGQNIRIQNAIIRNFGGAAVLVVRKQPIKNIRIENLEVLNCNTDFKNKGVGLPYSVVNNDKDSQLIIDHLKGDGNIYQGRSRIIRSQKETKVLKISQ